MKSPATDRNRTCTCVRVSLRFGTTREQHYGIIKRYLEAFEKFCERLMLMFTQCRVTVLFYCTRLAAESHLCIKREIRYALDCTHGYAMRPLLSLEEFFSGLYLPDVYLSSYQTRSNVYNRQA